MSQIPRSSRSICLSLRPLSGEDPLGSDVECWRRLSLQDVKGPDHHEHYDVGRGLKRGISPRFHFPRSKVEFHTR